MLTKRKWRKVLKVVYTEGIEPSFIVFKTIVLTISRSNTFNHHPFVGVAGLEPATNRVSDYSNQLSYTPICSPDRIRTDVNLVASCV